MTQKETSALLTWEELMPARMILGIKQPGHPKAQEPSAYAHALWTVLNETIEGTNRSQILAGAPRWRLAYSTLKGSGERALVDLIERSERPTAEQKELASTISRAMSRPDVGPSDEARTLAAARAALDAGYRPPVVPVVLPA